MIMKDLTGVFKEHQIVMIRCTQQHIYHNADCGMPLYRHTLNCRLCQLGCYCHILKRPDMSYDEINGVAKGNRKVDLGWCTFVVKHC